jgi:hypothetical protein
LLESLVKDFSTGQIEAKRSIDFLSLNKASWRYSDCLGSMQTKNIFVAANFFKCFTLKYIKRETKEWKYWTIKESSLKALNLNPSFVFQAFHFDISLAFPAWNNSKVIRTALGDVQRQRTKLLQYKNVPKKNIYVSLRKKTDDSHGKCKDSSDGCSLDMLWLLLLVQYLSNISKLHFE